MDMSHDDVFKVADTANKTEVDRLSKKFGVDVVKVIIMNVNGKLREWEEQ